MINLDAVYTAKLKEGGLSNTIPRRTVFTLLRGADHKPLTMNELIRLASSDCDRASVYRAVEALEKAGIIHKVHYGWKYRLELSEDFHGHHHHIACSNCAKIVAIESSSLLENALHELAATKDFSLTEHSVELRGLCGNCQSKNP